MKTQLALTVLVVTLVTSCVSPDKKWLSLPLPPDPLRDRIIELWRGEIKPPGKVSTTPSPVVATSNELKPPPAGFMFTWRRTKTTYEIRGITGPPKTDLTKEELDDFLDGCKKSGWSVWESRG